MDARRFLSRIPRGTAAGLALVAAIYLVLSAALTSFLDAGHLLNVALVYLLVCLVAAAYWGYVVGLVSAIAADLLVNFFFVAPLHTFTVQSVSSVVALLLFLAVAAVGASMLSLLRRQVRLAEAGQAEASLLLQLTQEAALAVSPRDAMERLCAAITRALGTKGCAILRKDAEWSVVASCGDSTLSRDEANLAQEALRTGQTLRYGGAVRARIPSMPRRSTDRSLVFVPFRTPEPGALKIDGVIAPPAFANVERLLHAFANEASVADHRARLAEEARRVEALQKADELKSALLSSVSHDLRSPLTAIKTSIGSLRDRSIEWNAGDREGFLETIDSQTDRLTLTVTNLLEMSRIEGGHVRPKLEPIEACLLLEEAVLASADSLKNRPVSVDAPSGIWLRADYALVLQALVNLLQNAGRHSTPGQPVCMRAEEAANGVWLSVSDSGPGIPPAEASHIFEKFYRASGSGSDGTGLGLSIARAMIVICGGSVTVTSTPDGTSFRIELPRARAPSP
jgi:two-component system, OmpR family, sensor histidine kinase KdpD